MWSCTRRPSRPGVQTIAGSFEVLSTILLEEQKVMQLSSGRLHTNFLDAEGEDQMEVSFGAF